MGDLSDALAAWGGVARRSDLMRDGATRREIDEAVARGAIVRPHRGVYAVPGADPVLIRCALTNSLLTCVSAARVHGFWVLHEPEEVHIYRADGRYGSERAVVHRQSWVPREPRSHIASRADTLLHVIRCLPELEALVVVESAARQGFSLDFLRERLPGRRNASSRRILDMVGSGADSLLEILVREQLRRAGLRVRHRSMSSTSVTWTFSSRGAWMSRRTAGFTNSQLRERRITGATGRRRSKASKS